MHVLALCSGAGGLEAGLSLADPATRTVCWVEREILVDQGLAANPPGRTILEQSPLADADRVPVGQSRTSDTDEGSRSVAAPASAAVVRAVLS